MQYAWKDGFPWAGRADPAQVAGRINELAKSAKVTARSVLEDGRDPGSPHHNIFEWEDTAAAEKYRLSQAGDIIRSLVIVQMSEREPMKPTRAFVHVMPTGEREAEYVDLNRALSDQEMRQQVLQKALDELECWRAIYQSYSEFSPIIQAIATVKSEVVAA